MIINDQNNEDLMELENIIKNKDYDKIYEIKTLKELKQFNLKIEKMKT